MIHDFSASRLSALFVFVLLMLQGCIWGSVQYDPTLSKEVIQKIESRKTTRKEILEWLGPPAVLAHHGRTVWLSSPDSKTDEMQEVDSRVFFKYFLDQNPLSKHHAVYYYWNEAEDISGFSLPVPVGAMFVGVPATSGNLLFSELWVLVNRETDQVEGYVFLEGKEK